MAPFRSVVVVGLDGFEPTIVERLLRAGRLPHLAALQAQGGHARLRTTYPAQTPVAWSTFATGTNPGGHGIFDFLGRNPRTYAPILALTRYEQKNAFVPPAAVNARHGRAIWDVLSAAGIPSTVLRCPCTFPPTELHGRLIAGLGVPDLRGGLGTATYYTADDDVVAQEGEQVVRLSPPGPDGVVHTHLIGPRDPHERSDCRLEITLETAGGGPDSGDGVRLRAAGQPDGLELREGCWSDWQRVRFKTGRLQSVRGMVRFYLIRRPPQMALLASPVNFDPAAPLFPISWPAGYAQALAERLGLFYTTGMVEEHGGLINGRISEEAFLQQCDAVMDERERMLQHELARREPGLLFCLFDTPDRLQHLFWRYLEPDHPAHPAVAAPELAQAIERHYVACDEVVGRVMAQLDERTLLVVLSDHGMSSFQRSVDLNRWLHDHGFLALRPGIRPGREAGDFFHGVDWSRTRAYALGLGGIYLNRRGREAQGILDDGEADAVGASIAAGLGGLEDPERGRVAVRGVVRREQIYRGPWAAEAPDLLVNFSPGYRVSWGTPLGGMADALFEDNEKKWSGDHTIDPELVPGVLLMNRPFRADGAHLVDLAPTLLAALGVPKDAAMEGSVLWA